jgi:hypothetical protein
MQLETWYRLADRVGDSGGPYIGPEGAYIGPRIPLFKSAQQGGWIPRPIDELRSILSFAYGTGFSVDGRIAALRASAAALSRGEVAIAKIAMLRARLPAIPRHSADLLKYLFIPAEHPRWPRGDQEHRGGEFRPVAGDEGDAPPARRGRPRRRQDDEVEPAPMLPDFLPSDPPNAGAATPDEPVTDPNAAPDPESADAQEASLPPDEKEQRQETRALLNTFVTDNPDLFRQDPDQARRQFEALNDIPASIRQLPEYQSFWQMPSSYEAARVSAQYEEFPDMQAFKDEFGSAPDGWQYHHIVNQNPANQANTDINWRLHTTENVVLIPTWWHYLTFGPYNQKFSAEMTTRQYQVTLSYNEQWRFGIGLLWR